MCANIVTTLGLQCFGMPGFEVAQPLLTQSPALSLTWGVLPAEQYKQIYTQLPVMTLPGEERIAPSIVKQAHQLPWR